MSVVCFICLFLCFCVNVSMPGGHTGAGHGGQILLSPEAFEEIKDDLASLCENDEVVDIQDLGGFSFKGIPEGGLTVVLFSRRVRYMYTAILSLIGWPSCVPGHRPLHCRD